LGSWVTYGLGSENQNFPSFVVMLDRGAGIKGGPPAWGSGFLPATYQGTTVRTGEAPILHLQRPADMTKGQQRRLLDFVHHQNQQHLQRRFGDSELSARIDSYELAFRMQSEAPEMMEIGQETAATDKPVAGLLKDLKQRGLLEDTLVIWGGEFGRMPMSEQGTGRDHNPWGYTVWMAGGGVKPGMVYGATDEVGLRAIKDKVHVHDLHATILHLLGLDHELLTYFHNGREERLTDVAGRVVKEILA
jgi:arylsulfatase A-like enzyme